MDLSAEPSKMQQKCAKKMFFLKQSQHFGNGKRRWIYA
jgi:hypothetical protein